MILGSDVRIDESSKITRPELATIGNHVAIDFCFYCTTKLTVGNYIHISSHVSVIGGANTELVLEDYTFISTGSRIICRTDNMKGDGIVGPIVPRQYSDSQSGTMIKIEKFAGVGANSVVMPDVVMAEGSVLGSNSLLRKSTEPWTIYAGSPARPISIRNSDKILQMAQELERQ